MRVLYSRSEKFTSGTTTTTTTGLPRRRPYSCNNRRTIGAPLYRAHVLLSFTFAVNLSSPLTRSPFFLFFFLSLVDFIYPPSPRSPLRRRSRPCARRVIRRPRRRVVYVLMLVFFRFSYFYAPLRSRVFVDSLLLSSHPRPHASSGVPDQTPTERPVRGGGAGDRKPWRRRRGLALLST